MLLRTTDAELGARAATGTRASELGAALGLTIEPLGIVTDRFRVPDLAEPSDHRPLHADPEP